MRRAKILFAGLFTLSCAGTAQSTETITYVYDAKGRLIKVIRTGTVNNGATTTYTHDKADNRTRVTTTGK